MKDVINVGDEQCVEDVRSDGGGCQGMLVMAVQTAECLNDTVLQPATSLMMLYTFNI